MSRREEIEELLKDGNPEFEKDLEDVFSRNDLDKNGYIDKAEFGKAGEIVIKKLGGPGELQELLNSKFPQYDKNKDTKLSKDEFRVMLREIILSLMDIIYSK